VTQPDDGTYRGDPPPDSATGYGAPAGYGPPPGYGTAGGYGAPPGYGAAGSYGPPPGHGAAGGYGPPGWAPVGWRPPTNTMAIAALVLCFAFPPAGLVTGLIARRQIQRTREAGDGLALAAIIVGGISTALFVLGLVFWLLAVASISSGSFGP
jgi:hypothetical protein